MSEYCLLLSKPFLARNNGKDWTVKAKKPMSKIADVELQ